MIMKKRTIFTVLTAMFVLSMTSCSGNKSEIAEDVSATPMITAAVTEDTLTPIPENTPSGIENTPSDIESAAPDDTDTPETETTVTLSIGMEGMVKDYPYTISGKLTAEKLIAGIAEMTGWNLDLADIVTSDKSGMTVCFANTSAIFAGPPESQKKEFMVYDQEELILTILESIKETLQNNFSDTTSESSSSLDIYFCGENNTELEFGEIAKYVPLQEPYTELKSHDKTPSGTIHGKFMGFSDTSTVEVKIGKKTVSYQVLNKKVLTILNELEEKTMFTFEASEKNGISTITKVVEY